jgi:hypothetical protein
VAFRPATRTFARQSNFLLALVGEEYSSQKGLTCARIARFKKKGIGELDKVALRVRDRLCVLRLVHVGFELVLRRPIETAPFIRNLERYAFRSSSTAVISRRESPH